MKTQILQPLKAKALAALTVMTAISSLMTGTAKADFTDVNLAGWNSYGDFGLPNNSQVFLNLGAGATITGFEYMNLSFTTAGTSWLSEFVLSVNTSDVTEYIDWSPSLLDSSGAFGPASGSWGGATGGPGPFGAGTVPFDLLGDGIAWVTVYDAFDDGGTTSLDTTVSAGTLRIYYTPAVPEPATLSLLTVGLLGLAAMRRNRKN